MTAIDAAEARAVPLDRLRDNLDFLLECFEQRGATAYGTVLQSLLYEMPDIVDIIADVADDDPTEVVTVSGREVNRCRWCYAVEHQGSIRHLGHCTYLRATGVYVMESDD